jgi:hypothetical protein
MVLILFFSSHKHEFLVTCTDYILHLDSFSLPEGGPAEQEACDQWHLRYFPTKTMALVRIPLRVALSAFTV